MFEILIFFLISNEFLLLSLTEKHNYVGFMDQAPRFLFFLPYSKKIEKIFKRKILKI
jgi:hypothetical protein